MIVHTLRAKLLIFIVICTFAAGYFLVSLSMPFIGMCILMYLLYCRASFSGVVNGIEIEPTRTLSSSTGYVNVPFSVNLTFVNPCGDHVRIDAKDFVKGPISYVDGTNETSCVCRQYDDFSLSYSLASSQRGTIEFEGVSLTIHDKRGFFSVDTYVDLETSIHIAEAPSRLERADKMAKRAALEATTDGKITHVEGYEFEGVRDYMVGDRPSRIDWKSSSRSQTLLTKLLEDDESTRYYILLDVSSTMRKRIGENSKLHHSMLLSMQLSKVFLNQGMDVGFIAFEEYAVREHVPAANGTGHYARILDVLTGLPGIIQSSSYSPSSEQTIRKDADTHSFFSAIMPFISKTKRGFVSSIISSGIYETITKIVDNRSTVQHIIVFSDMETQVSPLISSLKYASSRNVKVTLLSPYSPWFGISLKDISVDEAEKLYAAYQLRTKRLHGLRGHRVTVIEETPEDSLELLYPKITRKVAL